MSDNPLAQFSHYIIAAAASFVGLIVGQRTQQTKIEVIFEDLKEVKQDVKDIRDRVDRLIDR